MYRDENTAETTPYVEALYDAILKLKEQGWNSFRIDDVAQMMGRKPTASLRSRLAQAERHGFVKAFKYYTDRGGLAKGYWIAEQQALPGMEQYPW